MAEGGLILAAKSPTFSVGELLHWPPEQFRYDMREADSRERVNKMDVAGRARALVWGPYVVLPPGRWRATARFSFDRWASRHRYYLEWGLVGDFAQHVFEPGREGVFEFIAEHAWDKADRTELRVVMSESSLGGDFEFLGAEISLISDGHEA